MEDSKFWQIFNIFKKIFIILLNTIASIYWEYFFPGMLGVVINKDKINCCLRSLWQFFLLNYIYWYRNFTHYISFRQLWTILPGIRTLSILRHFFKLIKTFLIHRKKAFLQITEDLANFNTRWAVSDPGYW